MQKYKIILIFYKTIEMDQRPKFKSRKTENINSLCSQIWHWFTKYNKTSNTKSWTLS